jgi:hypothetical protein
MDEDWEDEGDDDGVESMGDPEYGWIDDALRWGTGLAYEGANILRNGDCGKNTLLRAGSGELTAMPTFLAVNACRSAMRNDSNQCGYKRGPCTSGFLSDGLALPHRECR